MLVTLFLRDEVPGKQEVGSGVGEPTADEFLGL